MLCFRDSTGAGVVRLLRLFADAVTERSSMGIFWLLCAGRNSMVLVSYTFRYSC